MKFRHLVSLMFLVLLMAVPSASAASSHRFTPGESAATARFWTPSRVAEALGRDPVFGRRTEATSQPGEAEGPALHHRPVTVFRPEVGKILGWDRYGGYSCTGAVIDTPSQRLVLTAGHCVFADGVWANRMLFIPNYRNGRRPFGTFKVKTAWVSNRWQQFSYGSYGTNFDIALLVTRKTWNGDRIGELTGSIPYQAYPDRSGLTDIYGYPGAAMGGRVIRTCRNWSKPDWYGGGYFPGPTGLLARCNMAAGSSGGPWVSRYDSDDGGTIGVIDGLTSTGYAQAGHSYLTSPYLGRILVRLIRSTEGK